MVKTDFLIMVFYYEDFVDMPSDDENMYDTKDEKHIISDLVSEYKEVELTDEQYELLSDIWSKKGDKPELENIRADFHELYNNLSQPIIDRIENRYYEYGYDEDYVKKMMSRIGAYVAPVIEHDLRMDDEVVDSTFDNGIATDILKDGRKRIVACTDVDIDVLNSDASIIATQAFRHCTKLREVHLPCVVNIDASAFSGCLSLHTVELSPSVRTIDEFAFADCHFLRNINLPEGLKTIGDSAFYGCVNLKSNILLPRTANIIGDDAFAYTPLDRYSDNPIYRVDEEMQEDDVFNDSF